MQEPFFLTLEDVLYIHEYQIREFGGGAAVLNMKLLESAISQPRQTFEGTLLHPDLASMAAAYLFHIVQNHPFEDGNKRTGAHAAIAFLTLNGHDLGTLPDDMEALVIRVATSAADQIEIADYLRKLIQAANE